MIKLPIQLRWVISIAALALVAVALKFAYAYAIFVPKDMPIGYVAQDEVTNYDLTSNQESLFRTEYEMDTWSGGVYKYAISDAGVFSASTPLNFGDVLDARTGGYATRLIVTRNGNSNIAFAWNSLSGTQQGYLGTSTTGPTILNFLRGDRSNEGGTTIPRMRGSALGDIVHSRPYYVSDLVASDGRTLNATPKPTIFVGANDGMLHAFDAVTGAERWAYVPSMLIAKMKALTVSPYVHDYYVDGGIQVANILSGTKRILVGALGAGGKGLYALDITGPSRLAPTTEASAASNILWEITNASSGFGALGDTFSNPIITKLGGVDVVIVGNGYNNTSDYKARLFVINANTGALITSIAPSTADGSSSNPNGLSTPVAVDANKDGNVDTVYAGDLNGTLWKFDMSASTATALLTTSPAQPITSTPAVGMHPNGGYMVNFATGAMLTTADTMDTTNYYAYGIWDGAPALNAALLSQTIAARCYTASPCTSRVRTVSSNQPNWASGASNHKGWKVQLPVGGEKVVGDGSFIANSRFYFNTYNPTISTTPAGTTTAVKGENWLMELNYLTGGSDVNNLPFLDLNADVKLTDADRVYWRTGDPVTSPATANNSPIMTTDGIPVGKFISIGVMSQPILVQLVTLNTTIFNQNPNVTIVVPLADRGVAGGHFDVEYYYGSSFTGCVGGDCDHNQHIHEYDDTYDRTGINFLDSSPNTNAYDLSKAISNTSTSFKVLVQNQYLNPAVKMHIGNSSYDYRVDSGYIELKNYFTQTTMTATKLLGGTSGGGLPTYTRANIGSFAINMPVDAFSQKNWWGGVNGIASDVRVGLHPTYPSCVYNSDGSGDGNMYQPVIPPSTISTTGNGTIGYNSGASNNSAATGVRHNGALTIQIISASTAASEIEMAVDSKPEYGWRVKRDKFSSRVLAEYTIFWHYRKGMSNPGEQCYGDSAWTKLAIKDTRICGTRDTNTTTVCADDLSAVALANGTDPKIGSLGSGSAGTVTDTEITDILGGTQTVITYSDGYTITITRILDPTTGTTTVHTVNSTNTIDTTEISVATDGSNRTGGDERNSQSVTRRLSWRELVAP